MSDMTIQLLGGVSHGKILTMPDTVEKIGVPVMRVRCEHSPDGAGVDTVMVTYRQGENTLLGSWVADCDFHHLGWWCQVCSMNAELAMRESQVKELRADIERVRELAERYLEESLVSPYPDMAKQILAALDGEQE
jgi:hypothetical protein